MALEKAKLQVEKGGEIQVSFNPSEYNLKAGASYSDKVIPGLDGPITQYVAGEADTLSLTLMFNTYQPPTLADSKEKGTDVSIETRKISALTEIKGDLHRPPIVTFIWGALSFKGIVTSVDQNFTMFLADGMPVRARVTINLKAVYDIKEGKKKAPFESPDRTKIKVIHEGEQLWEYAWQEYHDPGAWRVIAKENKITNPLELVPGRTLKLPAL